MFNIKTNKAHKTAPSSPSLLFSTFILGGGLLVAKLIGAMYRIPLASILGGEGIGVYQMVFPLYSLLLTLSSSAIPASLAKVISENLAKGRGGDAVEVYRTARLFILIVSAVCGVLLFFFGSEVAILQGEKMGGLSYVAISPSILLVGFVACFRGKFQGMNNMLPTALSQICEQVGKLIFSIALPLYFGKTLEEKVALAVFGVTCSEVFGLAFLMLYSWYKKKNISKDTQPVGVWRSGENEFRLRKSSRKNDKKMSQTLDDNAKGWWVWKEKINRDKRFKVLSPLLKIALPMTVSLSIFPVAGILESGLIINAITKACGNGVEQFGIYSGVVVTMISLPLGICTALGTAIIPAISSDVARGEHLVARRKISFSIKSCMAVAIAVAMLFLFFSGHIVALLFSKIAGASGGICGKLLKWSFVDVVLSCFVNITSSILYSLSEGGVPLKSQLWGLLVRFVFLAVLLPIIGIYASLAGMFFGSVVSGVLNFRGINRALKSPLSARPLLSGGLAMVVLGFCLAWLVKSFEISVLGVSLLAICYVCFLFLLFYLGFFTKEELSEVFGKNRKND